MNHPNLKELSERIHENNKAAGWWDIPRPRVQTAWLVVTELAEAKEAERAGKYADLEAFEAAYLRNKKFLVEKYENLTSSKESTCFQVAFRDHIKDTFEDEIADAVIRILDFAASENYSEYLVIERSFRSIKDLPNEHAFFSVTSCLWQCIHELDDGNVYSSAPYMYGALSMLVELSKRHSFDLWQHVELKLKYNATRPKMHGGKKF